MNFSIRRFLLINLLLTITVATTLTIIGNYYLNQQQVRNHLDTSLTQVGLLFNSLLSHHLTPENLIHIQNRLNKIPSETALAMRQTPSSSYSYNNKYQFQIWSKSGQLILHTPKAPLSPLSDGKLGFSTHYSNEMWWRVFTTRDLDTGNVFMVSEPFAVQNQLIYHILQDDIYIMLLIYPLSALLIWFIVGRGLGTIYRITNELSHRAPHYLEAVSMEKVPVEICPLVNELNHLLEGLNSAFEREKRFAADAAHELRTPLAGIRTQAQVALRTKNSQERQEILNNVIVGVDRSAHVVQQLLTLSRLTPETTELEDCTAIDLAQLTSEVIVQLASTALDKQIEISFLSPNERLRIYGNTTALSVLIRNIIDNAIRYTPEKGHIEAAVFPQYGEVVFQVNDNGPGIEPSLYNRVFERFYRVLGNKSPGSGLGLAIVKQIASLHQARIKLGIPPNGKGLQVNVVFPRHKT